LDPEPLQKWAEEGYCVARIEVSEHHVFIEQELRLAVQALQTHDNRAVGGLGIIMFSESAIPALMEAMDPENGWLGISGLIKAVVSYGTLKVTPSFLCHLAERGTKTTSDNEIIHRYPEARSTSFALPSHPDYHPASAAVAHSRSLDFLKKRLDGPWFDLEAIWEEHTRLEFAERAVEETMNTMVDEPYVNHVPTMTGGIGRRDLTDFYAKHFIFSNPDDTELQLISRTVGTDRVVDEFIFSLTHDRVIDWL
jgi:carboxymethylenebutenolidase